MKVAMVTPGLLPVPAVDGGAIEVLIEKLVRQNELNKKFDMDLYSIYNKMNDDVHFKNTEIINVRISIFTKIKNYIINQIYRRLNLNKWNTSYARTISRMIKNKDYDFIIVHNNLIAFKEIYRKSKSDNMVFVIHNNVDENDKNSVNIAKLIADKAKKIIAVSEYSMNDFCRITGMKDKKKIDVVYNCINIKEYLEISEEKSKALMEKYSIDARDFVFMYSGRIDETKGVLQLIKAFKKIDIKNKKLIIVGERWFGEKSGIDDYLKQIYGQVYEIGEKIVFTGFVCPKDMPTYYSICDCIVIPSMCEETFGMVALEGMAAGKPLIITNSGGMMEVVDEKCAIIIEKEKIVDELPRAMLNMIKKHETFRNMGEYGKQRVKSMECFNEQRYLENFYSKIK